jgi:hypothetical protein
MLALTDQQLAMIAIGATKVPVGLRSRWLQRIAERLAAIQRSASVSKLSAKANRSLASRRDGAQELVRVGRPPDHPAIR